MIDGCFVTVSSASGIAVVNEKSASVLNGGSM